MRAPASRNPIISPPIDLDPASKTYSQVIHRLPMPNVGDELHHFGWNACASCHGQRARRYLIIPGLVSGRIHIVDTATPTEPKLHKVIEPDEIVRKTKLTAPHTVHCLADGQIMISMLGDDKLNGPGGFLLLDDKFDIAGRWEANTAGMNYNYDFWYQPRHNVMVSSEWAAPSTTRPGFKLDDVKAGKYGHHVHFWDWSKRKIAKSIDLGEKGMVPLEVRFHHNPDSTHGFVGAGAVERDVALLQGWRRMEGREGHRGRRQGTEGLGLPGAGPDQRSGRLAGRSLALLLQLAAWRHPPVRHPQPGETQADRPGVGRRPDRQSPDDSGNRPRGGPQMLQLSLDGKRLYVTDSLFSSWDNQFYPDIAKQVRSCCSSIAIRRGADWH